MAMWTIAAALMVSMAAGHGEAPSHAGCFVSNGTTMLAVKLTYDGYKFDIPGGCTNGREVSIGELLTTVRGGFQIYKCYLQGSSPQKGPDHEVSQVRWMDAGEIDAHLQHHEWRYQDQQAYLYLDWLLGKENNPHRRLMVQV